MVSLLTPFAINPLIAPFVVFAGPRGMSSRRACRSSIAAATCSLTLCRLRTLLKALASMTVSSSLREPSFVVSAAKSAGSLLLWNCSLSA